MISLRFFGINTDSPCCSCSSGCTFRCDLRYLQFTLTALQRNVPSPFAVALLSVFTFPPLLPFPFLLISPQISRSAKSVLPPFCVTPVSLFHLRPLASYPDLPELSLCELRASPILRYPGFIFSLASFPSFSLSFGSIIQYEARESDPRP